MNNLIDIVNKSSLPENYKYYWRYQFELGRDIIVPYLEKIGAFKQGFRVAEIGSAEGGVLAAFSASGSLDNLATDIASDRLKKGDDIAKLLNLDIKFKYHNIMDEEPEPDWVDRYDLVILRDVIEHLDDTKLALRNIRKIIKPGGYLYLTFPPYYSPFGGHQHTVANLPGKLPYIHLLPKKLFHLMISSGRENDIGEVKRLAKIRLTAKKLMESAESELYSIFREEYYLLRPVFKMKFGLPSLKITNLKFLPLVKSILSLEAGFVLKKND